MKKLIIILIIITLFTLSACTTKTQIPEDDSDKLVIHYFYSDGCPSCDVQEEFMQELLDKYTGIEIKKYNMKEDESKELLELFSKAYEERIIAAPATFISDIVINGFGTNETTGKIIENQIRTCQQSTCKNPADILREKLN
ncbi:MAG: thioredoxin family protein [Candidatus Woesearchaeota archaeon]